MELRRLRLVNFRLHAETELEFGSGITAIVGPNGAGKTTLLEAIAWALYGTTAARGRRETVVRYGAPNRSSVSVELDFRLGGHDYGIRRTLTRAELHIDDQPSPVANSARAVTAQCSALLGMNRDEFFRTYFTGQKELAVMAALGATDRGRFLSKLLGYERLRSAQTLVRSRRSEVRGRIAGLESALEDEAALAAEHQRAEAELNAARLQVTTLEQEHADAVARLDGLRPEWERLSQLRETVLSLEGEFRIAEERVRDMRAVFEQLDRELARALQAKGELLELEEDAAHIAQLREEYDRLDREARQAGERRTVTGELGAVVERMTRIDRQLKEMKGHTQSLQAARDRLQAAETALREVEGQLDEQRTTWVRDKQDAETKHSALRDQYRDLQTHRAGIEEAGVEGKCPTCARPLGEEFDSVLETLSRQLEEIESNGRFYGQRVKQLHKEPEGLRTLKTVEREHQAAVESARRLLTDVEAEGRQVASIRQEHELLCHRRDELERKLEDLPGDYDAERYESVRRELAGLDDKVRRIAELTVRAERAPDLVGEAEKGEQELSDREAVRDRLQKALTDAGYAESQYEEARRLVDETQETVTSGEVALAGARSDLRASERRIGDLNRRRDHMHEQARELAARRAELGLHEELDAALESLRAELNARMRPDLAELASSFLSDITDGRYQELELDEQYNVTVVEDGLPKPVISGGEEDVANLVLRLAISQMVAERAGQPLSLLVLDEIFGALDEHRRQNVIALLRKLANRFPQVVLITHIESVKDGVDRVLRVDVDPGARAAVVVEDNGVIDPAQFVA